MKRPHSVFVFAALIFVLANSLLGAGLEIGLRKQLFVDDYIIKESHNLSLEAGQATKHGIVLTPTLVTDFQAGYIHDGPDGGPGYEFGESAFCWFFSPHWDPDLNRFRLWYMAGKRPGTGLAYAESQDGIHWHKPLISRDGKSNLVRWNTKVPIVEEGRSYPLHELGLDGVTVMIDPTLPFGSPEKYKMAFFPNRGGPDCTTRLGYSADGLSWTLYNSGLPVTGRAADFSNQILWDPLQQRYLLLCRQDFAAGGGVGELRGVRIMSHARENDLLNHPADWKTLTTFVLNDPDPTTIPGTNIPENQIHTFPVWYYEGIFFALTDVLKATNRPVPAGKQDFHKRHEKGVWEFYMAPSRDGIAFDFESAVYPRKALIPRGTDGSFDKDCVRPPMNIITHQGEHWIYYLATNERWGARKWNARLGLAKLRLDGFFYLKADSHPGTLTTKPFRLKGTELVVNANAGTGSLQVEVLDENGNPIPEYSGESSPIYQGIDDIRFSPRWTAHGDLVALKGRSIQLRFTLQNATLYSFKLND